MSGRVHLPLKRVVMEAYYQALDGCWLEGNYFTYGGIIIGHSKRRVRVNASFGADNMVLVNARDAPLEFSRRQWRRSGRPKVVGFSLWTAEKGGKCLYEQWHTVEHTTRRVTLSRDPDFRVDFNQQVHETPTQATETA